MQMHLQVKAATTEHATFQMCKAQPLVAGNRVSSPPPRVLSLGAFCTEQWLQQRRSIPGSLRLLSITTLKELRHQEARVSSASGHAIVCDGRQDGPLEDAVPDLRGGVRNSAGRVRQEHRRVPAPYTS